MTRLSLNAPQAKALSYVEDATKVKHRLYRRGDDCANCHFYKGIQGKDYGPCALFPQNVVAAKGWCSAWAKQVK